MKFPSLIGKYLAKRNRLTPADAIVVVSGAQNRIPYAIDLYRRDYAKRIILSGATDAGPISDALEMKRVAIKVGVPARNIILDEKATNTYENALFVRRIVVKKHFKNIILVTSPYHQRRVYETFKKVFGNRPVILQNAPSIFGRWQYYTWWKYKGGIRMTISEYIKLFLMKVFRVYK